MRLMQSHAFIFISIRMVVNSIRLENTAAQRISCPHRAAVFMITSHVISELDAIDAGCLLGSAKDWWWMCCKRGPEVWHGWDVGREVFGLNFPFTLHTHKNPFFFLTSVSSQSWKVKTGSIMQLDRRNPITSWQLSKWVRSHLSKVSQRYDLGSHL